jgi:hypothetical protein
MMNIKKILTKEEEEKKRHVVLKFSLRKEEENFID